MRLPRGFHRAASEISLRPLVCGICLALSLVGVSGAGWAQGRTWIGAIKGAAFDALGTPIPGAEVTARNSKGKVVGQTVTDSHGEFFMGELPPGPLTLEWVAMGLETARTTVLVLPSLPTEAVGILGVASFQSLERLTGVVEDTNGVPVEGAWVTLIPPPGANADPLSGRSGKQGEFHLDRLEPVTTYIVLAVAPGRMGTAISPLVAVGTQRERVVVRLTQMPEPRIP